MNNLHLFTIQQKDRLQITKHKPKAIWFTGLSGSGKSTLANALEIKLHQQNYLTYVLDGDNLRNGINKSLGFSKEDRKENLRRAAEIAKVLLDAGVTVIAAFVSPLESDRAMIKEIIGEENYVEIFVNTPLNICEERDVKGLYKKARLGEIVDFTGISAPYEIPTNATIKINSSSNNIELLIEKILKTIFYEESI